VEQILTAFKIF